MTLQEFYDRIGGDYKATISRLPSEALIKKFVLKYPGDPSFNQLKDALAAQDWELAFRASHTLKGVAQNLGMDRLYKTAAEENYVIPSQHRDQVDLPGGQLLHGLLGVAVQAGVCKGYVLILGNVLQQLIGVAAASLWPPVVAAHEEVLAAIREL